MYGLYYIRTRARLGRAGSLDFGGLLHPASGLEEIHKARLMVQGGGGVRVGCG